MDELPDLIKFLDNEVNILERTLACREELGFESVPEIMVNRLNALKAIRGALTRQVDVGSGLRAVMYRDGVTCENQTEAMKEFMTAAMGGLLSGTNGEEG